MYLINHDIVQGILHIITSAMLKMQLKCDIANTAVLHNLTGFDKTSLRRTELHLEIWRFIIL